MYGTILIGTPAYRGVYRLALGNIFVLSRYAGAARTTKQEPVAPATASPVAAARPRNFETLGPNRSNRPNRSSNSNRLNRLGEGGPPAVPARAQPQLALMGNSFRPGMPHIGDQVSGENLGRQLDQGAHKVKMKRDMANHGKLLVLLRFDPELGKKKREYEKETWE